MPKIIKWLVALALLPVCAGAVLALGQVVRACGAADMVWVPMLAGGACWMVIFLMLPKPMWIYVFGHELTHAIWTWVLGGEVRKMKVTSKGGHVVVSKSNFLIALAPYFFPLYAVLVVLVFLLGRLIWDWRPYLIWFHLLLGAAYSFHLSLTFHILKTRQSDITSQGYFFSAMVIFLGNVSVLIFGLPLLSSRVGLFTVAGWWFQDTGAVFHWLQRTV